jgi:CheY-like chemotaxis protein
MDGGPIVKVLVVDDDPLVLDSVGETLACEGHCVHKAQSGEAGISAFEEAQRRGEPFSIVITDLTMPNIDGRRVAASVKQLSPKTPVVILTGWGQRLIADGEIVVNVNRVLSKPPKLRDLREALSLCVAGGIS